MVNGIDVIYYFAHDFSRAKAFYSQLVGAEPDTVAGDESCEWTLGDGTTFGVIKGSRYRPCNGVIFNVGDVRAVVAEQKTRGTVFDDDGELEETPVCFLAFGNDSEGNSFMLHERK